MNYAEKIRELKEKRLEYGVSQEMLSCQAGISRGYYNSIENGKKQISEELLESLLFQLEKHNPENPLEILFDYVRIRFPTTNLKEITEEVLRINIKFMANEERAFYGYEEQYFLGDIVVMVSTDIKKGVLLELKGRGCRQFEQYLSGQSRSWYQFMQAAAEKGGLWKRLDIAINDRYGILDIPALSRKCDSQECVSKFRSFKSYRSGSLIKEQEEDKADMGNTLYIGSLKSEVYFCLYEKDYEQYVKNGIPLSEAETKNRFEIRLKNERAEYAVKDLLLYQDAGKTAFSIINRYVRFVDKTDGRRRSDWPMSPEWVWFIGEEGRQLKLTTKPEPYTYERTLNWIAHQVAPTLRMVQKVDEINGTNVVKKIIKEAKLSDKHKKIIKQQTKSVEELIV